MLIKVNYGFQKCLSICSLSSFFESNLLEISRGWVMIQMKKFKDYKV